MTQWNGRMGKGYRRKVRELKREEAAERTADFEARIQRIMTEQNVTRAQAYPVAAAAPRLARRAGEILAERDRRVVDFQAGYGAHLAGEADPVDAPQSYRNGWERARGDEMGDL